MINGWRAAGISAAVARCRNDDWQAILDPFARMSMNPHELMILTYFYFFKLDLLLEFLCFTR